MGFNQIAEALGRQARRQLLLELLDHNPVAESNVQNSTGSEIALVHTHLPKLESMGYIVWNREPRTILKGPDWEEIEPVVQLLGNNREQLPEDTF
jgi:hypothetical protein